MIIPDISNFEMMWEDFEKWTSSLNHQFWLRVFSIRYEPSFGGAPIHGTSLIFHHKTIQLLEYPPIVTQPRAMPWPQPRAETSGPRCPWQSLQCRHLRTSEALKQCRIQAKHKGSGNVDRNLFGACLRTIYMYTVYKYIYISFIYIYDYIINIYIYIYLFNQTV